MFCPLSKRERSRSLKLSLLNQLIVPRIHRFVSQRPCPPLNIDQYLSIIIADFITMMPSNSSSVISILARLRLKRPPALEYGLVIQADIF